MIPGPVRFVCPICRGTLASSQDRYACARCAREYPVVCGIPDFRVDPDPYITIEDDRRKGERLFEEARTRSFEALLHYYYAATPEDPPDLAKRWTARALREVEIAAALLHETRVIRSTDDGADPSVRPLLSRDEAGRPEGPPPRGRGDVARDSASVVPFDVVGAQDFSPARAARLPTGAQGLNPGRPALLDIGCSTGALLIAARAAHAPLVGVDVAFRWLVVGQARLREAGVSAMLVCANAEHLPFDAGTFHLITATDTIEHVRDGAASMGEAARVAAAGARFIGTANNRYTPLAEPNVHVWGVGYLPRSWQARYVAGRRADLHPYRITLRSANELKRLFRDAGWRDVRIDPALLIAPHASRGVRAAIGIYNRVASSSVSAPILRQVAPRLLLQATR